MIPIAYALASSPATRQASPAAGPLTIDGPSLVPSIIALNVADTVFTLSYVTTGLADEANPMMAELLAVHPLVFAAGKLTLVSLGLFILWRHRDHPVANWALLGLFVVYYLLLLFHVNGGYVSAETAACLWQ